MEINCRALYLIMPMANCPDKTWSDYGKKNMIKMTLIALIQMMRIIVKYSKVFVETEVIDNQDKKKMCNIF